MSLLKMVCNELGLELGEEWVGVGVHTDPLRYTIADNKLWVLNDGNNSNDWEWVEASMADYTALIKGELKPKWKPKIGEVYYIPRIAVFKSNRYYKIGWENDDYDKWYLSNKMVFKTKEEATRASNKLLEVLKNE